MPLYWKKLIEFYGGVNKTFKHLKLVKKSLWSSIDDSNITFADWNKRIEILDKFKKTLQFYIDNDNYNGKD